MIEDSWFSEMLSQLMEDINAKGYWSLYKWKTTFTKICINIIIDWVTTLYIGYKVLKLGLRSEWGYTCSDVTN